MKRNLTGYQFGIYWTIHVSKALDSSNGNDCITLSIKNIDYKKMGYSVSSPLFTPMIKYSSTSTILFSKMIFKTSFNSYKTCLIVWHL
jgi:hypothetical protein